MFKHINQINEQAFLIDFGSDIDLESNIIVNLFAEYILNDKKNIRNLNILNCIPSYNKILIQFDPTINFKSQIIDYIYSIKINKKHLKIPKKIIEIPICYDDDYSLDLLEICKITKLTKKDLIKEHLNTLFHVYMIGFMPGLPYMGDTSKKLAIPRKLTPRIKVPKGSVAIVDKLCVIYPQESPGGWNIIGRTPIDLFFKNNLNPNLLRPGDKIKFKKISTKDYKNYVC